MSSLLLLLALVPFIGDQLKFAIYPQLEPQAGRYLPGDSDVVAAAPPLESRVSRVAGEAQFDEARKLVADSPMLEEIAVTSNRLSAGSTNYARYAPNATVQTGPGLPSWQWNGYRLRWSGPVDADQSLRLVILPSWLVSSLRVLGVGLLLLFVGIVLADSAGRRWRLPGGLSIGRSAGSLLVCAIVALPVLPVESVRAQTPDAELLKELEARLTRAPVCAPRCAEVSSASVTAMGFPLQVSSAFTQDIGMKPAAATAQT